MAISQAKTDFHYVPKIPDGNARNAPLLVRVADSTSDFFMVKPMAQSVGSGLAWAKQCPVLKIAVVGLRAELARLLSAGKAEERWHRVNDDLSTQTEEAKNPG